jgi:hypothetical protein
MKHAQMAFHEDSFALTAIQQYQIKILNTGGKFILRSVSFLNITYLYACL